MYDFYFGENSHIEQNEETFLISIKRMLPKWMNSIPDSEFLALHRLIKKYCQEGTVLVETGVGASTILFAYHAMKKSGKIFSWDTNAEKASQIRTVCVETISNYLKKDIDLHWSFVNSISTSEHTGLKILDELKTPVDFFFHDSHHVLDTIAAEIDAIAPAMTRGGIICMDDANYNFRSINEAFINVVRKKLGLPSIHPIEGNTCEIFHHEVSKILPQYFTTVEHLSDTYKQEHQNDIFFDYYSNEFQIKDDLKMENSAALGHRFDAWKVS